MAQPTPKDALPAANQRYGGHTRFELELEFVQMLSNPFYLNHLAVHKYLDKPEFLEYLKYLQYFSQDRYIKYLSYPGPTLKALELLQEERFRKEIIIPEVVDTMVREGFEAATASLKV